MYASPYRLVAESMFAAGRELTDFERFNRKEVGVILLMLNSDMPINKECVEMVALISTSETSLNQYGF